MRRHPVRLLEEEHLRYVLVAVVRAEERVSARIQHEERTRGHRLGRIPYDKEVDTVAVRGVKPLHAEIPVCVRTGFRHRRAGTGDLRAAAKRVA